MANAVSFIIPHRKSESVKQTLDSIRTACKETKTKFEILTISGNHPTVQRNRAIEKAKHNILYFLDQDSIILPKPLKKALDLFSKNKKCMVLGGPTLTPNTDTRFQQSISEVFSNFLAIGPLRARYSKIGKFRNTDDKELILCNLLVRKEAFVKYGLFNENLYPNEENEWIHRVKESNGIVKYSPEVFIFRSQRKNLKEFIYQIVNYGRGRGEQTKIKPKSLSLIHLIPIAFTVYVTVLFILLALASVELLIMAKGNSINIESNSLSSQFLYMGFIPFFLYCCIVFYLTLVMFLKQKRMLLHFPPLFFLNHFLYGIGFFLGLFAFKFKAEKKKVMYNIKKAK